MNEFSYLFLTFLILSVALKLWLNQRQLSYVLKHRDEVPTAFKESITLQAHRKAADYTIAKAKISKHAIIINTILLAFLTFGGLLNSFAQTLLPLFTNELLAGTALILSVFIFSHVIELPLDIFQTFKVEQQFGFNKSSGAQYIKDQLLQLALMLALGIPLLYALLWVMAEMGQYWWIYAWALTIAFTFFMTWLFPTVIAPLFNTFTPLEKGELHDRIQQLMQRCGFNSNGIYVMDGSRRSGHGNAYFTGVGNNKRIVFFDTLIDALEPEEIEAVLAHELGHFKCNHIRKHLIASTIMTLFGFAILGWLIQQQWFFDGLFVGQSNNAIALLLFILISPVFTVLLQPVSSFFQRKFEFEADSYASSVSEAKSLISALVKLYRDNASTLTPDPVYSDFYHSHPPASVRIAHLSDKISTL
jgi:STE24 endopeptidase